MCRRYLMRLVLIAVLVSMLGAALPAQAQPGVLASPSPVRDWLCSVWEQQVSTLRSLSEAITGAGPGIERNGSAAPNGTQVDQGNGIDPNG